MRSKSDNGKDYGVLGLFKKGASIILVFTTFLPPMCTRTPSRFIPLEYSGVNPTFPFPHRATRSHINGCTPAQESAFRPRQNVPNIPRHH